MLDILLLKPSLHFTSLHCFLLFRLRHLSIVTTLVAVVSMVTLLPNVTVYPPSSLHSRSQWPRGLRRRSTAARLLRSWVRIPPRAWMFVCCVLLGRGLYDGLIIRSKESYRLWRVVVCDQETS